MRIRPDEPGPLGATLVKGGAHFSVFSSSAESVELCLLDARGEVRSAHALAKTGSVHHGTLAGVGAGEAYAYRARGESDRAKGLLHDPSLLLLDPYARAMDTRFLVPRSIVVDDTFDWRDDAAPGHPWRQTVLYEVHVKGFTMRHPEVPRALRGTYAGFASEPAIAHLKRLGVTAVELLPIHEMVDERAIVERGLKNYWGYTSIGYFAPAGRYASSGRLGEQVTEFKSMVRALHAAGIEVILDVVYNHTAEGGADGPTLSFKGLDNRAYYRAKEGDPWRYEDVTGCGNSLDLRHPDVLRLVTDSLRYWVTEMHVDGFRFDLTPTLARGDRGFDPRGAFFAAVHQDPVLSRVKLIAEPWDLGQGGYQLGHFPEGWVEWNDRFRDAARRFWLGGNVSLDEVAARLGGSLDLFGARGPTASVNFITAHDGFTLRDLTQYARKHNEANGEGNRDGTDNNSSDNHGVEGDTDDPLIRESRERTQRALFATLLLAAGVPMITAGDEMGRTQHGNNNAYCQDNATSWVDWLLDEAAESQLTFARQTIATRHALAALSEGGSVRVSRIAPDSAVLTLLVENDEDAMLLLWNSTRDVAVLDLELASKGTWVVVLDTAAPNEIERALSGKTELAPRSVAVLRRVDS